MKDQIPVAKKIQGLVEALKTANGSSQKETCAQNLVDGLMKGDDTVFLVGMGIAI